MSFDLNRGENSVMQRFTVNYVFLLFLLSRINHHCKVNGTRLMMIKINDLKNINSTKLVIFLVWHFINDL